MDYIYTYCDIRMYLLLLLSLHLGWGDGVDVVMEV